MSRRGTPFRGFALCRALVRDPAYATLGAAGQRALVTAVIEYADRDGAFEIKYATLAAKIGCAEENAGRAMRAAAKAGLVHISHQRRVDGSQRSSAFRLDERIVKQADEIVSQWQSGKTKTSPRPGSDENVALPGSDENVAPGTALELPLNDFGSDENDRPSSEEVEAVLARLRDHDLLPRMPAP